MLPFSCKLRGLCPSCHQKRELLWADWANVLERWWTAVEESMRSKQTSTE
ncbi:MAG: hypothetical protein GY769_02350 [bacterium]|nr:hypothetical protein [bacterium]